MYKYAILANPGHNRIYFEQSAKLSLAELEISLSNTKLLCENIKSESIAGIPYITFTGKEALAEKELEVISHLSFVYAVFAVREIEGGTYLMPVALPESGGLEAGVGSMLKYQGKTNELFTRMMINVAVNSAACIKDKRPRLLDPVAGKGTTLLEGAAMGFDVSGVEISEKSVHEFQIFFKKYLENGKYKHLAKKEKISGHNPNFKSLIYNFEYAKTKEEFKAESLFLSLVAGDSKNTNKFFRKNSFDVIVGDLPYGIAHGNVTDRGAASRNPKELLTDCLPAWREVLKTGGCAAISWNKFLLSQKDMSEIFAEYKFKVLADAPYNRFEHRVDQAIKRDVMVAVKE